MTELPINSSRVSMTEADHVTPACHVSRRKWGGKWPHCEYFLLSLPTRAGGAATLRITPTQYMNININIFSTYIKSVLKVGVCCVSVIQSKYLSETTKAWLTQAVSISPTSCLPLAPASSQDCLTAVISLSRGIKQLAVSTFPTPH